MSLSTASRLDAIDTRLSTLTECVGKMAHALDGLVSQVSQLVIAGNVPARLGLPSGLDKGAVEGGGKAPDKRAKGADKSLVAAASGLIPPAPRTWLCGCGAELPWFFVRCTCTVTTGKGKAATSALCGQARPAVVEALAAHAAKTATKAA